MPMFRPHFDRMYNIMVDLLDRFYPEREITLTSSYPPFVTRRSYGARIV